MGRTFVGTVLFRDYEDRNVFLGLLSRYLTKCEFQCYAWALMDTHYHLLVHTSQRPLWTLMKPLNNGYARFHNSKYRRRGALFADRYKSIATQDQNYLEQILQYVHLNPVRGGMCRSIQELNSYPWTGHSALMGTISRPFQNTGAVLRRFGRNTTAARERYGAFIEQGLIAPDESDVAWWLRRGNSDRRDADDPACWVIGDSEFQKVVLQHDRERRLTIARYRAEGWTLKRVASHTAQLFGTKPELITRTSKRTVHADARKVFCFFARQLQFPTRETGDFLGIQPAAVSLSAHKGEEVARSKGIAL